MNAPHLAILSGAPSGQTRVRWYAGPGLEITTPKWKKFLQADGGQWVEKIAKLGFEPEDTGRFFTPFRADTDKLASDIVDGNFEEALKPFKDSLDRLAAAQPSFDAMMKASKSK